MSFSILTNELKKIFPSASFDSNEYFSISTDSRTVRHDQIFLPLVGEKFDGHDYINEVFSKGIQLSFCEVEKIDRVKENNRSKLILVDKTLDAYHKLANFYRNKINPKVIAITGSSGKTTVKDLIACVLSTKYKVHKTQFNFNNEIGVPKTILEMPNDTEVLILELAMRGKGEIKYLSKTSEPDIAIITNIGSAHIGRLGDLDSILKAKCEILEHLKQDGVAILHNTPNLIHQALSVWKGTTITFDLEQAKDIIFKDGKSFFLLNKTHEEFYINALGNIHVLNSLIAIDVALDLNLSHEEIQNGLSKFSVPDGRGNIIKLKNDCYLINESYNANPESLRAAILNLIQCWDKDYKKVLVLGELAELGSEENKQLNELVDWIKEQSLNVVITVGEQGKKLKQINIAVNVKDNVECCGIVKELLKPKTVVLIKGSRVAKLDRVMNDLITTQDK